MGSGSAGASPSRATHASGRVTIALQGHESLGVAEHDLVEDVVREVERSEQGHVVVVEAVAAVQDAILAT